MKTRIPLLLTIVLALGLGGATGIAQATAPSDGLVVAKAGKAGKPHWPGHRPGKIILGMSCGSQCTAKERELGQNYGVHRQFTGWAAWDSVVKKIRASHAQGRLPWISVKGPGGPAGWRAIGSGKHDAKIRQLAKALKANDRKPIILTFHHEPSNDGTEAQGKDWARANNRFRNVLGKKHALANVAFAPVLGDWLFNKQNKGQNPANWARKSVLKRASFLGIDLYENDSGETFAQRMPRILKWLARQGFPNKMIGIGEMGGTDSRYPKKSAVEFINESFSWAKKHTDKVGVVSYFNSMANSRAGVHWPLDESNPKVHTYRNWLGHPRFAS